jgi:hypothetical protein
MRNQIDRQLLCEFLWLVVAMGMMLGLLHLLRGAPAPLPRAERRSPHPAVGLWVLAATEKFVYDGRSWVKREVFDIARDGTFEAYDQDGGAFTRKGTWHIDRLGRLVFVYDDGGSLGKVHLPMDWDIWEGEWVLSPAFRMRRVDEEGRKLKR